MENMKDLPGLKENLQKSIEPAEILGDIGEFPYIEKNGQIHLFKKDIRALVAVTPYGPLVLMSWIGEWK